jgi:hypothetical protein
MSGQSPASIVSGEARANTNFVQNSTLLPKDGDWDALRNFHVIKLTEYDEQFFNCILPEGWSKVAGEDHRGSYLLDEKDFKRASMFVKSTSYDYYANISVYKHRYGVQKDWEFSEGTRFKVYDYGTQTLFLNDFPAAYYATTKDGKSVGVLFGGTFYCYIQGWFGKSLKTLPQDQAIQITDEEFYKSYHNRTIKNLAVINLRDSLPSEAAQKVADRLNQESGW